MADCARLEHELGVSAAMAQVLVRRGLADPAAASDFMTAEERHPPSSFERIDTAVALVLGHVERGSRIIVHGDYDCDGVASTAILVRVLRVLGADVNWFIPSRADDGYGLSTSTVERLAAVGTGLIITADCAITAVDEVARAAELGVDVLVTDHHEPRADGVLPDAPIVHPRVCSYPFEALCAAGVAYKLAAALLAGAGHDPADADVDLDVVALATIADCVPLVGENRRLVRAGLAALSRTRREGLRALLDVTQADPALIDEQTVAFRLAPRINAAGRLRRADAGVELLLTLDPARAEAIARELDALNAERRHVETRTLFEAEARLAELGDRAAYVIAGEGWHPGVIGIVASRLAERHHRPVVLISLDGETGTGSGRSIPAFDLLAGLDACAPHLLRHGGHRAAAGCTVARSEVEAFGDAFAAHGAAVLSPADLVASERVDAVVAGDEIGLALAEELRGLAPFGAGNPPVSLLVPAGRMCDPRPMGEGKHLRFTLDSGGARAAAVAFGRSRLPSGHDEALDATFALEVNRWNGREEPRLVLRSALSPAPGPIAFAGRPQDDAAAMFAEFEAFTAPAAPANGPPEAASGGLVRDRRGHGLLGTLGALVASGEEVLVACACETTRREALRGRIGGLAICSWDALERDAGIADAFGNVVALDPPPSAALDSLLWSPPQGHATHLAWGEPELRFSLDVLDDEQRLRGDLAVLYRALRDAPSAVADAARAARSPWRAGRLLRVLHEVGVVDVDVPAMRIAVPDVDNRVEVHRSETFVAMLDLAQERRQWLTRTIALAA